MFQPLKLYGAKKDTHVGVVGLGGLGIIGIKLAKQLGCTVTAISRGSAKAALATKAGADDYIDSKSLEQMVARKASLDIILNTIPIYHDTSVYEALVATGGKLVLLGLTPTFFAAAQIEHPIVKRSLIGGLQNTQEVINICASAKIVPEVKIVPVQSLNEIFQTLDGSNDTGLRYVLDIAGSLSENTFGTCNAPPPQLHPAASMSFGTIAKEVVRLKAGATCCIS